MDARPSAGPDRAVSVIERHYDCDCIGRDKTCAIGDVYWFELINNTAHQKTQNVTPTTAREGSAFIDDCAVTYHILVIQRIRQCEVIFTAR